MKVFFRGLVVAFVFGALAGYPFASQAQDEGRSGATTIVSTARVDKTGGTYHGPVYATINGRERKIADDGIDAWVIDGGRRVVYSGTDGSGGYENEGQSLRVYDARTGKTTKVMSEYVGVDDITEVKTASGKIALLVKLSDGGLGGQYVAVVDPSRGEVFIRQWSRIISRRGDILTLGLYREGDWESITENENANESVKVRPYKTERYNLSALLKRRVIVNKRDRP